MARTHACSRSLRHAPLNAPDWADCACPGGLVSWAWAPTWPILERRRSWPLAGKVSRRVIARPHPCRLLSPTVRVSFPRETSQIFGGGGLAPGKCSDTSGSLRKRSDNPTLLAQGSALAAHVTHNGRILSPIFIMGSLFQISPGVSPSKWGCLLTPSTPSSTTSSSASICGRVASI